MLQKIKNIVLSLSMLFMFAAPLAAAPATVLAAPVCTPGSGNASDCIQGGVCKGAQGLNATIGTEACSEQGGTNISGLITKIINILSVIVGIVAVIMIIIGGFRYITSAGSSEKVTAAKNTILYALIGLIIVALAQVIVRFVLTRTTNG